MFGQVYAFGRPVAPSGGCGKIESALRIIIGFSRRLCGAKCVKWNRVGPWVGRASAHAAEMKVGGWDILFDLSGNLTPVGSAKVFRRVTVLVYGRHATTARMVR